MTLETKRKLFAAAGMDPEEAEKIVRDQQAVSSGELAKRQAEMVTKLKG